MGIMPSVRPSRQGRGHALLAVALPLLWAASRATADDFEFFESRIRPILAEQCYECHSSQSKKLKGNLRLDTREGFLKGGDSGPLMVHGDPDQSLLYQAIHFQNPDRQMPPKGKLSEAEIADVATWIKAGAPYPGGPETEPDRPLEETASDPSIARPHWAFRPRQDPPVPAVEATGWATTAMDHFIQARQEARGLRPVSAADRRTLIRRATFDLTGLPPTPAEIEAFLHDTSSDAFAQVVERLLASPHYGERWGRHWLDVVRYADTAGETADFPIPVAYRYRDYVVKSFNHDQPYDQFIREQIAGDVLAAQGQGEDYADQVIAPGYLAISRRFGFGESYNYHHLVIEDTIGTLGKSILGLTIGCARCHDHKFDPISTADYYGLYGIFASSRYSFPGSEETKRPRDLVPLLPPDQVEALLSSHQAELAVVDTDLEQLEAERAALDQEIQSRLAQTAAFQWDARLASVSVPADSQNGAGNRALVEQLWTARFPVGSRRGIGWLVNSDLPVRVAGVSAEASEFALHVTGGYVAPHVPNPATATITFEFDRPAGIRAVEIVEHSNGISEIEVRTANSLADLEHHSTSLGVFTGSLGAGPFPEFATNRFPILGGLTPRRYLRITVTRTALAQAFAAYRIFPYTWKGERVREVEIATEQLEPVAGDLPPPSAEEQANLMAWEAATRRLNTALTEARQRRSALAARAPVIDQAYSMGEGTPQNARIQRRGDPLNLSDEVPRKFLDILGGQTMPPEAAGSGRLELAGWLTDPANPLTARVMVNRIWQYHFGPGLVRTANNFGKQGRPPSHPELLDYLASRFIESGWSVKAMHRLILLSSTYQLASTGDSTNERLDPENEFYWRFNRRRLDAESIRDAILMVSGGLNRTPAAGHPFPPQDQWNFSQHQPFNAEYATRHRSLYLMTQRIRRHSFLGLFDGPDANESTAARAATTTPLQALYLMNSPFIHEEAARLAELITRTAAEDAERVRFSYRRALGRDPTPAEIAADTEYVQTYLERGEAPGSSVEQREEAAWASHARVLLTRNEFLFVD